MPLHHDAPLDLVIRNTCANVAIILTKLHVTLAEVQALRNEISELRAANTKAYALFLELLPDAETRADAQAKLKQLKFGDQHSDKQRTK